MNTDIQKNEISRRLFLRILGWGSFFTALGISVVGMVRFFYPRVLFEQPSVFKAGFPGDFIRDGSDKNQMPQIYEKWKNKQSVYIVQEKNRIYAIHAKCTHLGCTPHWSAEENVFKCPCHGSQFHSNGENFAGPAPRPLDRFRIYLNDDGCICVDKSRIYTFKDFNKSGAYLEV
jgi:cytochrome b6-f complex iron-sulfur subunit